MDNLLSGYYSIQGFPIFSYSTCKFKQKNAVQNEAILSGPLNVHAQTDEVTDQTRHSCNDSHYPQYREEMKNYGLYYIAFCFS